MKPNDFFLKFSSESLLPFYYFYGEDKYLKNKAIEILLSRLGEKVIRGLNFEIFLSSEISLINIIDHARTIPLLGKRKIILLKAAEELPPENHHQLACYLKNPTLKTTLVLISSDINFRHKGSRSVLQLITNYSGYGMVVEFNHPYNKEIPYWINYLAKEQGKSIDSPAIALLQELIGNNLQEISQEIEKLALFVGERKEITTQDVMQVTSPLGIKSVFDLVEYIGNKKLSPALILLSQLLASGEQPLKILGLIASNFRKLIKARLLLEQGKNQSEIKSLLNMQEWIWRKFYPQINKFSPEMLENCIQKIWETDFTLKTQGTPSKLLLERLVMDLCS
ncbi:MAG: DNA polymerase III subunit delta [Desulfobacterota bacterium]|nr:DNA polymerase III subunit delta [Thermodesulfobacteriota bacterium]